MVLSMKETYDLIKNDGGKTPASKVMEIAKNYPNKIALRYKDLGIWEETTYSDFWLKSQYVSMALRYFGVKKGEAVAIHSENRPEWFFTDIGIQAIGVVSVGLYPTNPASEVKYLLSHSESKILFAEDQEQVDKALEVIDSLPNLEKIVYFELKGMYNYDHPKLLTFSEFLEIGKSEYESLTDFVEQEVLNLEDDDIAMMIYTSGTTGPPKGSMISHGNLRYVATQIPTFAIADSLNEKNPQFLSYLPLCHVFGRLIDELIGIHVMATINFAESIDTVQSDLREIQPTVFPAVPRILEKMHSGAMVKMKDASFIKKVLFQFSMKLGNYAVERKLNKDFDDMVAKILLSIGYVLSFRALKKKLGLKNAQSAVSGAAPIAPEVLKFFMALGVPLFEAYGMTENCAYATSNSPGKIKLGTVGTPNLGVEIKLADDGEILIRSKSVFKGYFKDEDATEKIIDENGWLHTGDVGEFVGEFLKIIDRKKDIIITSGGKNVSPSEIENKIKVSPFIKEALVIGDRRNFLSALIGIEFDTVSNWALRKNIPHTTYRDLSEKDAVKDLIWREISKANDETSSLEIRKFRMIPKELDHEEGEMTATQKVKRNVVLEQFAELIEEMYS
ncbi:MAG: long-chain fatty acid--CoA ligase [Actinomycetota bacterium]|nr:long-chain fatty acid--CoA ligase [Actinomycetota bacterium]